MNVNASLTAELARRVHILETQQPAGFTSVTRGAFRVASNEGLLVEGSAKVSGWLVVTGTANITGRLIGSGDFDWTGPCFLKGDTTVSGTFGVTGNTTISGNLTISNTLDVTGATRLRGNTTLENNLTLLGGGAIKVGPMQIDTAGAYGGRITSTTLLFDANSINLSGNTLTTGSAAYLQDVTVVGTVSAGSKSFFIPHPSRLDHHLRHGCTESPVAGVEYWGTGELGADGRAVVVLPDYFEALVKPGGRTILVTGRGYPPDWGEIHDGQFQVTGTPGGLFSWLVKAERYGADFVVEQPVYGPLREAA